MEAEITQIKEYLQSLQQNTVLALQKLDPTVSCTEDSWQREEGGGGCSLALAGGAVFEKGGVNFSHVMGSNLPPSATQNRPEIAGSDFQALGVSLVLHTINPYVPAVHMNVRFFNAYDRQRKPVWWFGGGFDLTPYYGFVGDCIHWHQVAQKACQPFGENVYEQHKKWCDQYFFLKHRQEARGIGGLFFDDINQWDFANCFAYMKSVGDHFIPAYAPIVQRRCQHSYGEREKNFQQFRRARYVEFNLVYDRGTHFGLQSGGRTESILVSMPPQANWAYQWQPQPGSEEEKLTKYYLKPKDWLQDSLASLA